MNNLLLQFAVLVAVITLHVPSAATAESYVELVYPVPQERLAEAQMQSETALANMQILQYTKHFEPIAFDISAIDFPDDMPPEYTTESNTFSSDQVLLFTPFDGDTVFLNNLNVRKTGPLFSWLGHVLDSSGAKIGWTSINWNPSLQSYRGKFHFYSPQRTIVVESLPNGLDSVMWEVDWNAFREHYSALDTAGEYQTHEEYRAEVEKWKEKIANDPEWSAWIKERDKRILERMKQQEATQESE